MSNNVIFVNMLNMSNHTLQGYCNHYLSQKVLARTYH
jgi:hypothetical protein